MPRPVALPKAVPSRDKPEGASLGKLSMRRAFVLAACLAIAGPSAGTRAAEPVDLELVLTVDTSGSIDLEEAQLQRDGYLAALVDPRVIGAIRAGRRGRIAVAYVEWAGSRHAQVIADWALIHDGASARTFASAIARVPVITRPWTSISDAIDFATPLFNGNGFEGTRRVIDISGDGPNNSGRPVTVARDEAVAARITINGLAIINDRPGLFGGAPLPDLDLYYRHCVIGGARAFLVIAEDFGAFAAAIRRKLIIEIAGIAPAFRSFAYRADPTPPRLWPASTGRAPPPCDVGERRLRQRMRRNFFDLER